MRIYEKSQYPNGVISERRTVIKVTSSDEVYQRSGSGTALETYTHTQTLPQSTWTINHGLGKHPSVSFRDSAGTGFMGSYEHVSDQQIIATFTNPVSGYADCN